MKKSDFDKKMDRIIKSPSEIKTITKSVKISNSCIDVIKDELCRRDITEKKLARIVDNVIRKNSAKLAFPTIVACGKRGYIIHAKPTNKRIRGLGYIDFGAKYKGYCTDVTVPFVKGAISEEESRILNDTLLIYDKLVKSVKMGSYCWKLHEKYSKFLKKRNYEVKHSLGHGLGLDVHEFPHITIPSKKKLTSAKRKRWEQIKKIKFQPGMVFTIEPGIYVKGIGGCRIENDFLMTSGGSRKLTKSKLLKTL